MYIIFFTPTHTEVMPVCPFLMKLRQVYILHYILKRKECIILEQLFICTGHTKPSDLYLAWQDLSEKYTVELIFNNSSNSNKCCKSPLFLIVYIKWGCTRIILRATPFQEPESNTKTEKVIGGAVPGLSRRMYSYGSVYIIILGLPHQISGKKRTYLFPPKNQAPFSW